MERSPSHTDNPFASDARIKAKVAYHHGDLKEQLVAATRVLVEEEGPDRFSVSAACRKAGVSTAAPYRHFADRREMLMAVAVMGMAEMRDSFLATVAGKTPGSLAAISAVGLAYVRFAEQNPGVFRMMFADVGTSPEKEQAGESCYRVLLDQVALYLGKTDIDETVLEASFPLWTFVHGAAFLQIDGKCDESKGMQNLPDLISSATACLLPETASHRKTS